MPKLHLYPSASFSVCLQNLLAVGGDLGRALRLGISLMQGAASEASASPRTTRDDTVNLTRSNGEFLLRALN